MNALSKTAGAGSDRGVATMFVPLWMGMRSYWQGDLERGRLLGVCIPAGVLVLGGGLALSAGLFPGPFDWRYQAMCTLASPVKNPAGHVFGSLALLLVFLAGLPTCGYFARRLSASSLHVSRGSAITLRTGYLAGIVMGLETVFFPNFGGVIYKAHEIGAIVTIAGTYLGVAGFWFCLTVWLRKVRGRSTWFAVSVFLLAALPMTGVMLSQAWLFFDPNRPGWVSREWIALGIPVWLSFAFWEWLAIAGLVICVGTLAFVLPGEEGNHG